MGTPINLSQTNNMKLALAFTLLVAYACAFQAPSALVSKHAAKPSLSMAAPKWAKAAAAAPLVTVLPALAEGTGEPFGVNDSPLAIALAAPLILALYIGFDQTQDDLDTDFFDSYDSRRPGDRGNN